MTNQRFYTSAFDERLIYFDGIEWHRFYIRKRRITCAEIINADFDTHGIKLPNRSGSVAWVGGGRAFNEFYLTINGRASETFRAYVPI